MTFFSILSLILFLALLPILYRLSTAKRELEEEKEQVQKLEQEKDLVLSFLEKAGDTFTAGVHVEELLKVALDSACNSLKATGGAIFVYNRMDRSLKAQKIEGVFPPFFETGEIALDKAASKPKFLNSLVEKHKIKMGADIIGDVAQSRTPLLIGDGDSESRLPHVSDPSMQIRSLAAVPLIVQNDLFGVMAVVNKMPSEESFSQVDLSLLESLADQVALSLSNARLHETRQQKETIDRELVIAKDIQQLLFPKTSPKIPGFDLSYMTQSATEVGGDYFDFIPIDENRIGIVIADVSGKGVPGALIMTMVRSIMRSIAPGSLSSRSVLCELNKQISKDLKQDMFITMLYMILDSHNRILTFVRAGHDPLIHYHTQSKKSELVSGKGMAIGIMEGPEFEEMLEERVIKLDPEDVVCIYTDGATEAKDSNGKEFGREGLCDAISVAVSGSAQSIALNIRQRIYRFTGGTPQHDDLTLLVLKALP